MTIVLDSQRYECLPSQPISLSTMLKKEHIRFDRTVSLQLIIPQGAFMTLNDDLLSCGIEQASISIDVEKDSRLTFVGNMTDCASAKVIERVLTFSCKGQGAQVDVHYRFLGRRDQVFTFKTFQHHVEPDSQSALRIKGVLHDQARLTCNNLIRIEKNAQRVHALQENKNLLLGRDARVVTIPKLEVEADNVHCQHGAAISRLDEEQLFYLESRGLRHRKARQLLIDAFLQ